MVGAWKNRLTGSSTPKASAARATTWVTSNEWPPSLKKSSSTPIPPVPETPSTSAQMPARISSWGVRGAADRERRRLRSGSGSALRSTLPRDVRGSAASGTKTDGIM